MARFGLASSSGLWQGKKERESAVYVLVNEHFEFLFNAASAASGS
jgi:hypothetical protein